VSARVAGRTASLFGIHRYHIHRGYVAYGVSRRTARASAAAASQTRRAYPRRRRSAASASYTAWTLGQSHLALLLRVPQCATKNENTTRAFEVLPHAILLWGNDAPYNGSLHLPPTLARLLPKTRTTAASERAHTRAEGGQVQAVVRLPLWFCMSSTSQLHQHKSYRYRLKWSLCLSQSLPQL
jgi:hypothetical protein